MSTTLGFATVTWPILSNPSHDDQTKTVQHLLRAHGNGLAPDGIFGPGTEAAVRDFQDANGLTVDGIVGRHTWSALIVTVRRGDHGDAVRAVQWQSVVRHGEDGLAVDGDFGPLTEEYVRDFQFTMGERFPHDGIAVDGVVGPVTWRAFAAGLEGLGGE
jgi:peptidoglycan hydrolase-like protein with peptidoglycan-binding domain